MPQSATSIPKPKPRGLAGVLLAVADWIADLGGLMMNWVIAIGDVAQFFLRTLSWIARRLPRADTLLPNFYQIGVLSLPHPYSEFPPLHGQLRNMQKGVPSSLPLMPPKSCLVAGL
jgi:hypothetical protein